MIAQAAQTGATSTLALIQHIEEAAHLGQLAAMALQHRLAENRREVFVVGVDRRERVALLQHRSNRDSQNVLGLQKTSFKLIWLDPRRTMLRR